MFVLKETIQAIIFQKLIEIPLGLMRETENKGKGNKREGYREKGRTNGGSKKQSRVERHTDEQRGEIKEIRGYERTKKMQA